MGNLFDVVGFCYTCYDEGVLLTDFDGDVFINDFCPDCEKGQGIAEEYEVWYANHEMNEYTKENA